MQSRRDNAIAMLDCLKGIDFGVMTHVTPLKRDAQVDLIVAELEQSGAPEEAYAISSLPDLDGRFVRLDEAIDRLVGWQAPTFLSCIPERLGYLEYEGTNAHCIYRGPNKART